MSQKSPIAALSGPMEYTRIGYEQQNQVATITLDRPKAMNAIDEPMRFELFHAFNAAMADDQVRAIVIRANGDGFSAGTDLQEAFERQDNYGLLEDQYRPLINQVLECPKPVIAAVQGACAGVGASIALACDLMVMGESAFIYLAFANVGLIPDGGMCWHLARNLGYKRAYQIIAEADRIPASTLRRSGERSARLGRTPGHPGAADSQVRQTGPAAGTAQGSGRHHAGGSRTPGPVQCQ